MSTAEYDAVGIQMFVVVSARLQNRTQAPRALESVDKLFAEHKAVARVVRLPMISYTSFP